MEGTNMPISLKKRFEKELEQEGGANEVVNYTRINGDFKAMDRYGVKDYLSWQKFKTEMGCPNIGLNPVVKPDSNGNPFGQLVSALTNRFYELKTENERLRKELLETQDQLSKFRYSQSLLVENDIQKLAELIK